MKYKLVVSDMDGTLLNSEHAISEYTKNIISKVMDKGVKFIIATGRPYEDAKFFRDSLGLESFLVTSNGAIVHDEKNNEIIAHHIDENLAKKLLAFGKNIELYHRNIYAKDGWFVEYSFEELDIFHKESGFSYNIVDLDNYEIKDVNKIFFLGEKEDIKKLYKKTKEEFQDSLSITLSSEHCVEFMNLGVNKGTAIKELAKKMNIELDEIVAFGDALNDYEMLAMTGESYIMSNAISALKKKLPEKEIIDSCDNDGVAKKLAEIFEIEIVNK